MTLLRFSRRKPLLAQSLAIATVAALAASRGEAQSNQRFSVQGSLLRAQLLGDAYPGFASGYGFELQLRYTHSALSVGGGYQRTSHALAGFTDKVNLSGVFIEPRYVLAAFSRGSMAPYVSSRLSLLQQQISLQGLSSSATGLTINVGGGLLVRLTRRVNGEVGVTYGFTNFGDFTLKQPDGQTTSGPSGSGSNIVARIGMAVGLFR
jgi:hypothetical protein